MALLLFIAGILEAQTGSFTLKGSLKDASDGSMMPYTNCVLLHATDSVFAYGVTSDDHGVFCFKGVAAGSYLLRVSCIGYETHWQSIDIHADKNLGVVRIAPASTSLDEVQITASRPLYSADGEKVFYNVGDDPSVQSGNATDALQNAPGVEVDAEGNIKYRGGAEVMIRTQTLLAEVDPYFTIDCGMSTDLFNRRLSLFLNVNDLFNTVRTGGESVNPYHPSSSESTLTSRYISFGLTWRIGRTEMESQQTHGKKPSGRKNRQQTDQDW